MLHCYDSEVAKVVGIPAAAIFHNSAYWIFHNETNGTNLQQGEHWTYNSAAAFSEQFPELTQDQVRRALEKLRDAGFIKVGNFNKNRFDRTSWYAIGDNGRAAYETQFCRKGFSKTAASITKNSPIHSANSQNGRLEITGPIPNSTQISTHIKKTEGEYARAREEDGEDHTPPGFPQVAPAPVPDLGYPKTPQEVMDKATMAGIQGATIDEAEAFLDYYSSRGWLAAAGVRIINWQASFRNWIRIGKYKKAKGAKNEDFRGSNAGVRQPYIEGRFNVAGDGYEYSDLDRIFGKESDSAGTGEAGNAGAGARP